MVSRRNERAGRTSAKDSYDAEAWKAWGLPSDLTPDDVKAIFSAPDDDDTAHQQTAIIPPPQQKE